MKNTDIPIRTKYPVLLSVTMSNSDNSMQNIFPRIPPIVSNGMKTPPGNPVAFDIIVIVAKTIIVNKLPQMPKLLFSMISNPTL